jgi:hypothetical protein
MTLKVRFGIACFKEYVNTSRGAFPHKVLLGEMPFRSYEIGLSLTKLNGHQIKVLKYYASAIS